MPRLIKYEPSGKYRRLNETDKQDCAQAARLAEYNEYIERQIDRLAGFVPNHGPAAAAELLCMLSAYLCEREGMEHYWERLSHE